MTIELSEDASNAIVAAIAALVDAGPGAGAFLIYTAGFATLLATATCPLPAFDAPVSTAANLSAAITGIAVIADGTAAVFRLVDGAGQVVLEGTVGATGSGEDLEFAALGWASGDTVSINNFTING